MRSKKEGEDRYKRMIPPGYEDAKQKDGNFLHENIEYERKYGDLIIWKQILDVVSEKKLKNVIFVTDDQKKDWVHKVHGKTIGVRPELYEEITLNSDLNNFYIYDTDKFAQYIKEHLSITINDDALQEIQESSKENMLYLLLKKDIDYDKISNKLISQTLNKSSEVKIVHNSTFLQGGKDIDCPYKQAVFNWLSNQYDGITYNHKFLDFSATLNSEKYGYKVVPLTPPLSERYICETIKELDTKAYYLLKNQSICKFSVLFIMDDFYSNNFNNLNAIIRKMKHQIYPQNYIEIIVANLEVNDRNIAELTILERFELPDIPF